MYLLLAYFPPDILAVGIFRQRDTGKKLANVNPALYIKLFSNFCDSSVCK